LNSGSSLCDPADQSSLTGCAHYQAEAALPSHGSRAAFYRDHLPLEVAAVSYPDAASANLLPTLIIDIHGAGARQLAEQLAHSGFTANSADTCAEALAAVLAQHHRSMIFLGEVSDAEDVRCIAELRKRALHSWIIMISSTEPQDARELYLRYGVDAQIITPFPMADLVSRLMAFSRHSRPP
jgi:CheY-like chemotaxis protein